MDFRGPTDVGDGQLSGKPTYISPVDKSMAKKKVTLLLSVRHIQASAKT